MRACIFALIAVLTLAPIALGAEETPPPVAETPAICDATPQETPAFLLPAAQQAEQLIYPWWTCPNEICQANCEHFCGEGLGRCTSDCYCECW